MVRWVWVLGCGLVLSAGWQGPASAEIKDYQIRRMLMLKTECGVSGLDIARIAKPADRYTDRFLATCENVTHYPDGVEIVCPDTEDEHDCRMLTVKRGFPHLNLPKP